MKDKKILAVHEFWGFVFTVAASFILHFVYPWTEAVWAAVLGAVNESVWEHTKILYTPYLLYAIYEYVKLKPPLKRFFVAKTVGLLFIDMALITFFFTYSGILGYHVLWLDIGSAVLWALLAHYLSYRLLISNLKLDQYFPYAVAAFVALLTMKILFTWLPPHINLFFDNSRGFYGPRP